METIKTLTKEGVMIHWDQVYKNQFWAEEKNNFLKKKMSIAGDPVLILVEHLFNED